MARRTTYEKAVHWLHNNLILCNELPSIDATIYDNARFEWGDSTEIFQWYLTDASEGDVEWLERSFGLLFTYSELLGHYVLCVDHFGTAWDYVNCDCYNDDIADSCL